MTKGKFFQLYTEYNGTMIINTEEEKNKILEKYKNNINLCLCVNHENHKLEIITIEDLIDKINDYEETNNLNPEINLYKIEMEGLNSLKISKEIAYDLMNKRYNWLK